MKATIKVGDLVFLFRSSRPALVIDTTLDHFGQLVRLKVGAHEWWEKGSHCKKVPE